MLLARARNVLAVQPFLVPILEVLLKPCLHLPMSPPQQDCLPGSAPSTSIRVISGSLTKSTLVRSMAWGRRDQTAATPTGQTSKRVWLCVARILRHRLARHIDVETCCLARRL